MVWTSSIVSGTLTLANDADNRIVTATGSNSLNGEANLTFDGTDLDASAATGGFTPPSGTTAQRPGSPSAGETRYNSTGAYLESYINSNWYPIVVLQSQGSGQILISQGANGRTNSVATFKYTSGVFTVDSMVYTESSGKLEIDPGTGTTGASVELNDGAATGPGMWLHVSGTDEIGTPSGGGDLELIRAGESKIVLTNPSTTGDVHFSIRVEGDATPLAVTVGAADSGGSGFRLLRVPN